MNIKTFAAAVSAVCLSAADCFAGGMLLPADTALPALEIKSQRMAVEIKDGVAEVKIEQVFCNREPRPLEAVYVFPLPENSAIRDFAMYMNGKRVSGEILEKGKAREIYAEMLRRLKDPALLELMSENLFRARVYPVPAHGDQRIEIAYTHTLGCDGGLYRFEYPLKTYGHASRVSEDFSVSARIVSSLPITTVYSPSHKIGISRKGEYEVTAGFEEKRAVLDRDFALYYGVSEKRFGANLLTHRRGEDDGFFMLILAPPIEPDKNEIVLRDIVFVLDTSGSMAGEKIEQARDALKFCVHSLNDGDRFNIVRFSSDVETFRDCMSLTGPETRRAAVEFINRFKAGGGTDIAGALAAAFAAAQPDSERQKTIVFLTDGQPTVGILDPNEILKRARENIGTNARLFVFGVGDDVNTRLLDALAAENKGSAQYVSPAENIEVKVSVFYDKISRPVLQAPEVAFSGVAVSRLHPNRLPDLFAGEQLLVFGRFRDGGKAKLTLTGLVNGRKTELTQDVSFPAQTPENAFIPALWAARRIGFLLEQIKLSGPEKELEDEIIALSKEYGIITPYTAYLVAEDPGAAAQSTPAGVGTPGPQPQASTPAPAAGFRAADAFAAQKPLSGRSGAFATSEKEIRESARSRLERDTGREAVEISMAIKDYKNATEAPSQVALAEKRAAGKTFRLRNGVWTDTAYGEEMKLIKVKYASDKYFEMLEQRPDLKPCLALGEKVLVCLDANTALLVE